MKKQTLRLSVFAVLAIFIGACAAPAVVEGEPLVVEELAPAVEESIPEESVVESEPEAMNEAAQPVVELPDWFYRDLTNVTNGETFRIVDFQGKVVLVETLATWCSNCLRQQNEVLSLMGQMGDRDDFVSLGIDIDTNGQADQLADYVSKNGFFWLYTVADSALVDDIGALYGPQYLNPPSTPMLIIDKQGNTHQLPFGVKSAADLLSALQPFLDA